MYMNHNSQNWAVTYQVWLTHSNDVYGNVTINFYWYFHKHKINSSHSSTTSKNFFLIKKYTHYHQLSKFNWTKIFETQREFFEMWWKTNQLYFCFYDILFTAPVVVTTTTIPVPPSAGYPAQSAVVQGYPMPQPQPG